MLSRLAVHLSHEERNLVVEAARAALDEAGVANRLIVGAGASSTRETIELCKQAHARGADACMVIAPGYFAGALSKAALRDYFVEVGNASPAPVSRVPRLCGQPIADPVTVSLALDSALQL